MPPARPVALNALFPALHDPTGLADRDRALARAVLVDHDEQGKRQDRPRA